MVDKFAIRAEEYDQTDYRLRYVDEMAEAIRRVAPLGPQCRLLDFGAGTGLLSERLAPDVGSILAVDISASMIEKLEAKRAALGCKLQTLRQDLSVGELPKLQVDGIVSTMTLHHIADPASLLRRLARLLRPGGFIALCDIDTEDGSFHTVDTGVEHFGFERDQIRRWLKEAGFGSVIVEEATTIRKPHGEYSAFLAYGVLENG